MGMDPRDKDYPVLELCKYDEPTKLQGFAAGHVVSVRHGCILRTVFRDVSGRSATVAIEYRVIPDEVDTGHMILLGAKTIGPEGLDVRTTSHYHEICRLGLRCERAELSVGKVGVIGEEIEQDESVQEIAYFRTLEDLYVPEGECMHVELSSGDRSEGDYWVGECGEGEVGVLEGPVSLSLGRLSAIIRAPDHEPLFVEKGERVARGLKLGSVSKRPANVLPPDDWLVDDGVLEGPEARTASRFRAQPTSDAGGADGTEGPEGGKVRTAQRLRAQPSGGPFFGRGVDRGPARCRRPFGNE